MTDDALLNNDRTFNRFNDAYVKYLFASQKHIEFLLDLINAVFDDKRPLCVKGRVNKLTLEERELNAEHDKEKTGRLDILAETDAGQIIDIEIQTYGQKSIGDRDLYYFAKLYGSQEARGKTYRTLKPVVIINLMAYNHFQDREQYHSCYELRERDMDDVLSDKISVHIIEAQKCSTLSDKNKSRLARWMNYLTYSSPDDVLEMAKEDILFAKVLEAEKMFFRDKNEMLKYEAQQRYEMETASIREEGYEEGEAKGMAKGMTQKSIEIAKNLFKLGVSLDVIKSASGLSDEELSVIQESSAQIN